MTGTVMAASEKAVRDAMHENLSFVMTMAEAGESESAKEILMRSGVEKVRKELGEVEDFNKLHENDRVNQLYAHVDESIHSRVKQAMLQMLTAELANAGDDGSKKENLQKIIQAMKPADNTLN